MIDEDIEFLKKNYKIQGPNKASEKILDPPSSASFLSSTILGKYTEALICP